MIKKLSIESVLDQSQLVLPSLDPPPEYLDAVGVANWEGRKYGLWYQWPTAPTQLNLLSAQTFIAGKTGILSNITLMWGSMFVGGYIRIQIQTTDTLGVPTGTTLETIIVKAEDIPWAGELNVTCNGLTRIVAGTKYAIVVDSSNIYGLYGYFFGLVMYYGKQPSLTADLYNRGEFLIYYDNVWATPKNSTYIIERYYLEWEDVWIPEQDDDVWYGSDHLDLYFKTYVVEETEMKDIPIKDGLSAYFISDVAKAESGYNYYGYIAKDGSVIIFRENIAGTEYRYANGGTDYTNAWTNRATLTYQTIEELLA